MQTVGVGDVMLRAEGRESMPNAFGTADLFGRTRPTGVTVVQYGGLRGGNAVLLRSGQAITSTATSMNSTPTVVSTRNSTVVIPASGGQISGSQLPIIPVEVDLRRNPRVPVADRTIVIDEATATSITFVVE